VALFSRRPKAPATAPDPAFPYWDLLTADEFRALVRSAFAECGREVEAYADHVVDAHGSQYGLANLAATCHNDERGRKAWNDIVTRHVRAVTAAMGAPSPFESLTDAEVLDATYCRVMPTSDVLPTMSYAPELAPGISMAFNLDLPERVAYFTDDRVTHFGAEVLRAAGETNLKTVRVDERRSLERAGGRIDVVLGESLFIASLVLVLADFLRGDGIEFDPEIGVFVAMPYRHQLDFHVPRDITAIASVQLLAEFAAAGYRDSAGPVSPAVYWWRPQALERVSVVTDDGISIDIGPELGDVLTRIAER
jgi:hypothetical protein